MAHWDLASGGVAKWGQGNMTNYTSYIDFLTKWRSFQAAFPPPMSLPTIWSMK
jgi:hypothetical protein